jgi:hypothetical protein
MCNKCGIGERQAGKNVKGIMNTRQGKNGSKEETLRSISQGEKGREGENINLTVNRSCLGHALLARGERTLRVP